VIYIHGFSASAQEVRPVPDQVARALGANLFFTRLAGHGRSGPAMAEPSAGDWIEDIAEAMAVGRKLGERVLIISTSTGGTLAAIAATDPDLSRDLAGIVMISPNFGVKSAAAKILDLPFARVWGPLVAGGERSFEAKNAEQLAYWTTSYPTLALFPMAGLVRHAVALDYSGVKVPVLVVYSAEDQVVDPAKTLAVMANWGGQVSYQVRTMTAVDDAYAHVIAGDVMSPAQTAQTVALISDWANPLQAR
jgi:alpha-beta hydrolase superfamily lysophospholipase